MPKTLHLVTQEARRQSDWPYRQDWIVSRVALWEQGLVLEGTNLNYPEDHPDRSFYWLYIGPMGPFSWRFDFTNAVFE